MANISEALLLEKKEFHNKLDAYNKWREIELCDCGTLKRSLPQSDYDIALEELNREFPGVAIEHKPERLYDMEKSEPSFLPVMIAFAVGVSLFLFIVLI